MKHLYYLLICCILACLFIPAAGAETPDCVMEEGCSVPYFSSPALQNSGVSDAETAIKAGLMTQDEKIDLSGYSITPAELNEIFTRVIYHSPELFYVKGEYEYYWDGSVYVTDLLPVYRASREAVAEQKKIYREKLEEITSTVDKSWSKFEILLYLHDYMAIHYQYDMGETSNFDAYSLLTEGKGVCQSYMLLYMALLNHFGIENTFVSSSSMGHIWNAVKLDGEWYHVDVTWDDPALPGQGEAEPDYLGMVRHTCFLCSDSAMTNHTNYTVANGESCDSTTYDTWFGISSKAAFTPLGGMWYYISGSDLYQTENPQTAGTSIYTFEDMWCVWEETSSYWTGVFSSLAAYAGILYCNGPSALYGIDPNMGSVVETCPIDTADGYVYGFTIQGRTLTYLLAQNPNACENRRTDTLDLRYTMVTGGGYSYCVEKDRLLLRLDGTSRVAVAQYNDAGQLVSIALCHEKGDTTLMLTQENVKLFALGYENQPLCEAVNLNE